jgi:hypothetical protein
MHAADVASAFVSLLDSTVEGPVNIGTDERAMIAEVIDIIAGYIGRRDLVRLGHVMCQQTSPWCWYPTPRVFTRKRGGGPPTRFMKD